jgi:hypothetical protein
MPITVAAIAPLIGCVCSTCRGSEGEAHQTLGENQA